MIVEVPTPCRFDRWRRNDNVSVEGIGDPASRNVEVSEMQTHEDGPSAPPRRIAEPLGADWDHASS
jgi:hypothetical protein